MTYDGDFESYSDGAGAHQQGLDLWEFRITAHMGSKADVDVDALLRALVEMCRAVGANGIGYGAERLRLATPEMSPRTNAPRTTSAPRWQRDG